MQHFSQRSRRRGRGLAALLAGVTVGTLGLTAAAAHEEPVAAEAAEAHSRSVDRPGRLTPAQRTVIREATAEFVDPANAVAAGYLPTDDCVEAPGLGGMGFHYVKPALMGDGMIDPTLPEILVYAPQRDGSRKLVAVEYIKFDGDQDLATADDKPTLFGESFEGPMPGHGPGMPVHYDLHAWVWKWNPAGILAGFNPQISCTP